MVKKSRVLCCGNRDCSCCDVNANYHFWGADFANPCFSNWHSVRVGVVRLWVVVMLVGLANKILLGGCWSGYWIALAWLGSGLMNHI